MAAVVAASLSFPRVGAVTRGWVNYRVREVEVKEARPCQPADESECGNSVLLVDHGQLYPAPAGAWRCFRAPQHSSSRAPGPLSTQQSFHSNIPVAAASPFIQRNTRRMRNRRRSELAAVMEG
jgi:hypothetical protein